MSILAVESQSFNPYNRFDPPVRSISAVSKNVVTVAYKQFFIPVATGIKWGAAGLGINIILAGAIHLAGWSRVLANQEAGEVYTKLLLENVFKVAVVIPVIEEVIFRVIVQGTFHWIAQKVFPDRDISIFSHQIKLAALVSVVASAILFGLAHYSNGMGITQLVACTVMGLILGALREKTGILSSISAHITNNGILCGISML